MDMPILGKQLTNNNYQLLS